jgi:imidazolonepropionase-like amidohydrolase
LKSAADNSVNSKIASSRNIDRVITALGLEVGYSQFDSASMMSSKIALINVRVFDGARFCESSTVVIDGGLIGSSAEGAQFIDCHGDFLLPGFIDAHVHLVGEHNLRQLSSFGITTALDMTTRPQSLLDSLRSKKGVTDIRSAGIGATSPGSKHSQIPLWSQENLVSNPADAARFVKDRIAEGADYIKIITDIPGPDQATVNALVSAAQSHGKLAVAHAVSTATYAMAQEAKVDMITHAPLDAVPSAAFITRMAAEGTVVIPTLTMMERAVTGIPGRNYKHARASVNDFHKAGIPILAGTDANSSPFSPFPVPHGESLHREMELLVEAGMSTVDVLRAATSLPAKYFGLGDRGDIKPGMRADLVLLGEDPLSDIRATRCLRRVWCRGVEVRPASW